MWINVITRRRQPHSPSISGLGATHLWSAELSMDSARRQRSCLPLTTQWSKDRIQQPRCRDFCNKKISAITDNYLDIYRFRKVSNEHLKVRAKEPTQTSPGRLLILGLVWYSGLIRPYIFYVSSTLYQQVSIPDSSPYRKSSQPANRSHIFQ